MSAFNALLAGRSLEHLPIERHAGRVDLRGAWLVSSRGLVDPTLGGLRTVPTMRGVTLAGLDLTGATAQFHLDGATMIDCVLDGAFWQGWRVWESVVQRCSFTRTDLRGVAFDAYGGTGPAAARTTWRDCTFTRTRLDRYTRWGLAEFDRCRFDSTGIVSLASQLGGASFLDCVFTGTYSELDFGWDVPRPLVPAPLQPVLVRSDLSEVVTEYLTVSCPAVDCRWPAAHPAPPAEQA